MTLMNDAVIYAKSIEDAAINQISRLAMSPLGEFAHIRIMPNAHAGKACTIGTTMHIDDKVCPNLVGVDIGCGVRPTLLLDSSYLVSFDGVPGDAKTPLSAFSDDELLEEIKRRSRSRGEVNEE